MAIQGFIGQRCYPPETQKNDSFFHYNHLSIVVKRNTIANKI